MNGIIVLNKEAGMTSFDACNKVKRILGLKKVGHTGTLDPNVTGVLPICLNEATKLADLFLEKKKEYIAEIILGITSDTLDLDSPITSSKDVPHISDTLIDDVIKSFLGSYDQIPPMYSALKVNGKKLYEYAREGIVIERKAREITIYEIDRISDIAYENNMCHFKIKVVGSKGLYIRTLAFDIGTKLGYPSLMGTLIRTKSGIFTIENSYSLDDIRNNNYHLLTFEELFSSYEKLNVNDYLAKLVKNGVILDERQISTDKPFLVYHNDCLIAIYKVVGVNTYKPLIIMKE